MNFDAQDIAAPAWGAMSATQNLVTFCVPINAPLDQKQSMSSQPIPNNEPTLDLLTPKKNDCVALANQIFSICHFLVFYSLP